MTDAELEKTKRDLRIGGYHYRNCATAFNCKCNCGLEEIVLAALQKVSAVESFEYCEECNFPLSDCGEPNPDGTPSVDCRACQLVSKLSAAEAQLAEAKQNTEAWKRDFKTTYEDLAAARAEVERLRECLQSMLDAYEELHAKYDLGDCEATIAARAAMSNPEKQ